jgi:hypothetical protein
MLVDENLGNLIVVAGRVRDRSAPACQFQTTIEDSAKFCITPTTDCP